ncbi:unnamed protein product [Effrenium voratum]|nr:unnamed protein product [Effrenium voratum]
MLYLLATVARGLMIGMLWPLVNFAGGSDVTRTTWKECLVMTWGGLRGAVGLALALSMRNLLIQQGKEYTANLMVFFVSGFATLTLLVNATTCSALLQALELTKPPEAQIVILSTLRKLLVSISKKAFTDSLAQDGRFKAVQAAELDSLLEHLESEHHDGKHRDHHEEDSLSNMAAINLEGETKLKCWSDGELEIRIRLFSRGSILVKVREMLSPYFAFAPVTVSGGLSFDLFTVVAFIDAHHTVCHRLMKSDGLSGDAREDVINEACAELESAHTMLKDNHIGAPQISKVRTMQLATMLFEVQKDQVMRWQQQGVISDKETEELLHNVKHGLDHSEETLKKKVLNKIAKARETMMGKRLLVDTE